MPTKRTRRTRGAATYNPFLLMPLGFGSELLAGNPSGLCADPEGIGELDIGRARHAWDTYGQTLSDAWADWWELMGQAIAPTPWAARVFDQKRQITPPADPWARDRVAEIEAAVARTHFQLDEVTT